MIKRTLLFSFSWSVLTLKWFTYPFFKCCRRYINEIFYSIFNNHSSISVISGFPAFLRIFIQTLRPKKSLIEQRRAKFAHQIQQIGIELKENLLKLKQNTKQWQPSVDSDTLSNAINECVKNAQRRLKDEFNYKKEMLTCNWNDHQLIAKFYKLKPNEEQIQLAKKIRPATADELRTREQLEILRQRISLKRLPPTKTDKMINQLLDDNQKTLSNPFLELCNSSSVHMSRCIHTFNSHCFKMYINREKQNGINQNSCGPMKIREIMLTQPSEMANLMLNWLICILTDFNPNFMQT